LEPIIFSANKEEPMEPKMTPIIPIKQVLILFAGYEFLAVQLLDGRIAVVFNHFCEALHVSRTSQLRRIQANPTLAKNFLLVRIQTPGGPQDVNTLVISVLTLWLGGFDLTRLSEEKRHLIIHLQEDAEAAFSRPFQVSETTKKHSAQLPRSEQATSPVPALLRALADHIEQEQRVLVDEKARMERQRHDELAWRAEIERRLRELQAEVMALRTARENSPPAADAALSGEHEEVLHVLLYCAERMTGQPQEQLERNCWRRQACRRWGSYARQPGLIWWCGWRSEWGRGAGLGQDCRIFLLTVPQVLLLYWIPDHKRRRQA
jgi:hypothetical protein